MSTRFLRRRAVATRYDITMRTVDRWSADGRLPAPVHRGAIPLWNVDELDAADRAAAAAHRTRKSIITTTESTAA